MAGKRIEVDLLHHGLHVLLLLLPVGLCLIAVGLAHAQLVPQVLGLVLVPRKLHLGVGRSRSWIIFWVIFEP